MKRCAVCEGTLVEAAYTARSESDGELLRFPGHRCLDCGTLGPDEDAIAKMAPAEVPSSMRLRCALRAN